MTAPLPSILQQQQQKEITTSLHRIRFIDQTPSPITALSFAPLPLPTPSQSRAVSEKGKGKAQAGDSGDEKQEIGLIVVGRENGDLEVWQWGREEDQAMGNWVLQKTLPPTLTHPTMSLMVLVIRDPANFHTKSYRVPKVEDLRCFTAGSDSGDIVERCLLTGRILSTYPIPSPPLWSLSVSPTHTLLCLSTMSPSLHFLSIPSDSSPLSHPPPQLLRSEALPSRTKTVSIAWGPPKIVDDEWVDTYLVTGNSDSSFRKWDLPDLSDDAGAGNGRLGRVSLTGRSVVERVLRAGRGGGGKKAVGNQKGTIVWGVGVLPDHTIVTSDSLGSVTFWDGASLAQKQSFSAHKADGMCMVIGPSGKTVFTSGPDQRICQFTYIPGSTHTTSTWAHTSSKRVHMHDVRSLSIFPPYIPVPHPKINASIAPVLASGGWDMSLTLTPCAAPDTVSSNLRNPLGRGKGMSRVIFEDSHVRRMGWMEGNVVVGREGRLVACRNDRGVGIWRVLEEEGGWEKVLEMDLRLRTNLLAHTISHDGRWLAVSDLYETKLFSLSVLPNGQLHPHRVKTLQSTLLSSTHLSHLPLESTGTGCTSILFTPDSQRLVLALARSGQVVVVDLRDEGVAVAACFRRGAGLVGGRVVMNMSRTSRRGIAAAKAQLAGANASTVNGHVNGNGDGDVGMSNGHANGKEVEEDDDEDDEKREATKEDDEVTWVKTLVASEDGQWLGVSDLSGIVSIFNLDTLRPHAMLPTLPHAPTSLNFPPSHPSLLCIQSNIGTLQFYHIEHRRLLPPTPQISTLNRTILDSVYTPSRGATFEPSRANPRSSKVVLHGPEWVITARLDLEMVGRMAGKKGNALLSNLPDGGGGDETPSSTSTKSLRRKRAREAREALEAVSLSGSSDRFSTPLSASQNGLSGGGGRSSALDPGFVKVWGGGKRFKGVIGVGWLGVEDEEEDGYGLGSVSAGKGEKKWELGVIERPWGDFAGELPAGFWVGKFGRS